MVNNQKKILFDRLRHVDIDAGYTDTSGLLILFADLDLSDLDLMTIRDLLQYTPEPHDESLIGMLGLMFSALGEGSLCLVLDMVHLKKTVLQKAVPAVVKLVSRFLRRLDEGRYDTLIDRTAIGDFKPLVLDNTTGRRLLYFQKFHYHEHRLKRRIKAFLSVGGDRGLNAKSTRAVIDALYYKGAIIRKGVYGSPIVRDAEQVEAIRMALVAPLLIVSGGPGTGKTSLLVNILRALVRTGTDPTRIVLAAPTGRAAQGMSETLAKDLASVAEPDSGDLQLGRLKGSTLHKLLVYRSRSGDFYHGERCFIPADVIVVDEVSMVDVVMMDRLFQAIHPVRTRVILIGDKNQLPSVEAGSVLADLSSFSGSAFVNHFVELRNVYRSTGQLLDLAQAINFGHPVALKPMDFDRALNLEAGQWAFVTVQGKDALNRQLDRWVVHQYVQSSNRDACSYVDLLQQSSRQTVSPASLEVNHQTDLLDKLFAFTRQCRILTVLRHGFTGARWVNERISNSLRQILDPESSPDDRLFNGALIIITRNDYTRDLFNGDVGLVMGRSDGLYQAYFKRASEYVAFPASGLTDWDLAFAMTVHKSQGSEFDDALLVLPEDPTHRLLTREIIYTAVTRASQRLMVCGTKAAFQTALERKLERQSGLMA